VNRRVAGGGGWQSHRERCRFTGHGPASLAGSAFPPAKSNYAVIKDPTRGKRQGSDEPRAQEIGDKSIYSDEREPLNPLYKKEKSGFGVLLLFS
jgi:hypothetical protein